MTGDRTDGASGDRTEEDRPAGDCRSTPGDGGKVGGVCRGEVPDCYCPLEGVVDVLARKYAMQIVCVISAHGTVRFRDVEDHLPTASTSTLSARLSDLQEADLVERTQYDEIPPRVEYALTEEGRELGRRLQPLLEWARERETGDATAD